MKHLDNNHQYCIGIDSGSTMCKVALLKKTDDESHTIVDTDYRNISWQPVETARLLSDTLLQKNRLSIDNCRIVSTGYGREQITWAHKHITEITTHGKGASHLNPYVSGVIDIGGQDSKVMKLEDGKVSDFLMNDKCAAGTGRFLELACSKLDILLDQIDNYVISDEYAPINSMCAVFAESEIIGLLSSGTGREKILNGVIRSICSRIANMTGKINPSAGDVFLLTGGLSQSDAILETLKSFVDFDIIKNELSPYAGAVGAALL